MFRGDVVSALSERQRSSGIALRQRHGPLMTSARNQEEIAESLSNAEAFREVLVAPVVPVHQMSEPAETHRDRVELANPVACRVAAERLEMIEQKLGGFRVANGG